jgi:hypothetical protein
MGRSTGATQAMTDHVLRLARNQRVARVADVSGRWRHLPKVEQPPIEAEKVAHRPTGRVPLRAN